MSKEHRERLSGLRQRGVVALTSIFALLLTSAAFAQGGEGDPFAGVSGIMDIICTVQDFMSGTVSIAIGILILAIGGLMIAFGGKRSIPFVIWGIIGVSVALAAPSLFFMLTGHQGQCVGGQWDSNQATTPTSPPPGGGVGSLSLDNDQLAGGLFRLDGDVVTVLS